MEHGKPVLYLPIGQARESNEHPSRIDKLGALNRASIQHLLDSGKQVLLVYMIPEVGWDVPRHLQRSGTSGSNGKRGCRRATASSKRGLKAYTANWTRSPTIRTWCESGRKGFSAAPSPPPAA